MRPVRLVTLAILSSPLRGEAESERSPEPGEATVLDTKVLSRHPLGLRQVVQSQEGRGGLSPRKETASP
jgi:hypothetical protein